MNWKWSALLVTLIGGGLGRRRAVHGSVVGCQSLRHRRRVVWAAEFQNAHPEVRDTAWRSSRRAASDR
jgi:hypothetical protein